MQTKSFTCPVCGSRFAHPTSITLLCRPAYSGADRTLRSADHINRVEWETAPENDGSYTWRYNPLDRCCGQLPGGYASTPAQARADAIAAFQRHAAGLGIIVLEKLPVADQGTLLVFWPIVQNLEAHAIRLNHSAGQGTIALNMSDLRSIFVREKVQIPVTKKLANTLKKSRSPDFITVATIKSALTGEMVECLIFKACSYTLVGG